MKLVSYTAVRTAISFDAGVQQSAIEAAIEAATEAIAVDLRVGSFARAAYEDTYFVTRAACLVHGDSQYRTRLALTAGFVVAMSAVSWSGALSSLADDATPFDGTDYVLTREKGGLLVLGTDLRDAYVKASYTAGFEPDTGDATLFKQDQVPDWLKQAATVQSIIQLDQANPTLRHEKDAGPAIKEMTVTYKRLVEGKLRYFPSETYPL